MNKKEIKDKIIEIITQLQGCKAVELVTKLPDDAFHKCNNIVSLIHELIKEGKLVEVEYKLPNIDYYWKSFLLPADTKVRKQC